MFGPSASRQILSRTAPVNKKKKMKKSIQNKIIKLKRIFGPKCFTHTFGLNAPGGKIELNQSN